LAWYEFDPSWLLIKVLKAFGVAKSIKVASIDSQLLSDREAA
jgi:stearoyl-CoA desaturase (delta-9 desaturase)